MIAKVTAIIPLLFTSCLSQFSMDLGTRADMTFGEDNDRYDIEAIMQDQTNMDMVNQFAYRRLLRRQNEKDQDINANKEDTKDIGTGLLEAVKQAVDQLTDNNDLGYHSDVKPLVDGEYIDEEDYEKNIQKFAANGQNLQDKIVILHGGENGRRGIPDPENEILFQYGVPVKMKLNGFLQVPLTRK